MSIGLLCGDTVLLKLVDSELYYVVLQLTQVRDLTTSRKQLWSSNERQA